MSKCLCRMITFVNYHVPSTLLKGVNKPSYVTMGFFDGMLTEVVPLDYGRTDLKPLWKQSIRVSGQSKGAYSCQNTFCFSQDDWSSSASDSDFWDVLTDKQYPLCFIVYFQIRNYAEGANGVADQCRRFNWALRKAMDEAELAGEYYTYATIDKNDVVVCIKSSQYKKTVGVIKKLHDGDAQIVYSYTVLSVNRDILGSISQDTTPELFCEIIDSICLKGIANSCRCQGRYLRLDDKYKDFCEKLIDRLGNPKDYRIYDILGESDFRLIARDVQFGRILNVLADGELLSCDNSYYKFCLYISELLLNTEAASTGMDPGVDIRGWNDSFEIQTQAELCRKLAERMEQMNRKLAGIDAPDADEKAVTFSSAIRQLDYSLCALEAAPTKKYDFYSIYEPLETLVSILEDKLAESEDVGEYMLIYDFIHKISMTFHGTLRTDIQFFQIRDFNVIVHYAPAKLRAFYSLWTTKAAYFFERAGGQREGSHKFVVAPGMFGRTSVKELFPESEKTKSLMLITIPERNLYIPKWMVIVLTHEVSHFVGGNLRRREEREGYVFSILARIMELEVKELAKEELMDGFPESGKYLVHNELRVSRRLN
ncbi:MAG: hypothetical protein LIO96_00865 [Lachnospiraceae bacterium]|nr:hypothetical protein [Lachnospiraceae bacterium]